MVQNYESNEALHVIRAGAPDMRGTDAFMRRR